MVAAPEWYVRCEENQAVNLVSAVKELSALSPQELSKLIEDAENDTIQWVTGNGSPSRIKVESLARYLALHLIAKILTSKQDEELFKYLLRGFRLLHALCGLIPSNSTLEEVLLQDIEVSKQMLDLVLYMIIVLCGSRQEFPASSNLVLVHSALLACSLHLLKACFPVEWHELVSILLAHPKVDIFMGVAFAAVRIDIQFIQVQLSAQYTDTSMSLNLAEVNRLCLHCDASLQFLLSLCQQKPFQEHLVKNKEPFGVGGVLLLAQDILKLPVCEESYLMATVSRLKSKVLFILLHLCEAESLSFLDVGASTNGGLDLTESIIFKTEVLTTIFTLPHGVFLSRWCSSEFRPSAEDATLDFDSLAEARWVLDVLSSSDVPEPTFSACRVPRIFYAPRRTSLLVKAVANLTRFLPGLCKEERDVFVIKFLQCLEKELPKLPDGVSCGGGVEKAAIVNRNLRSLLIHAESLIPFFVTEDDWRVLRFFIKQLEPLITPQEPNINQVEEAHSGGRCSSPVPENSSLAVFEGSGSQNKGMSENSDAEEMDQSTDVVQTVASRGVQEGEDGAQNVEASGLDSSTMQLENSVDTREVGLPEDERVETVQSEEQQLKRRKRNIMNSVQISMIEKALQDEPDMHRKPALIQSWADKINLHGSEVTASQLKNWINNRRARLARAAAKDQLVRHEEGQYVVVTDETGVEIGKGCIHLAHGIWFRHKLVESGLCVVDITHLKVDKTSKLPHPCDHTGDSFEKAHAILGRKRVLWDSSKLIPMQQKPNEADN